MASCRKVLKHGTRRRVRHRRQFHCKFETLDFEKDKFTVKFARTMELLRNSQSGNGKS